MRCTAAVCVAVFCFAGGPAWSHAFGARYDLPLPLGFYLAAAAAAVALSFIGAWLFLKRDAVRRIARSLQVPPVLGRIVSLTLRVCGLLFLAIVLGAAFFGPDKATGNFATIGVWVIWWVGFLLTSSIVVSLWPWVDPFRTLARAAVLLAGRRFLTGPECPRALGWLAPLGLFALAWVELVSDWSDDPRAVGAMIILYATVSALGALAWGMSWFSTADPLSRVFELLGRVTVFGQTSVGTLEVRLPGEGLVVAEEPRTGEVALVTTLIAVVLFDGISETPIWSGLLDLISQSQSLRPLLLWLREEGADLLKVIRTAGLVATVISFFVAYWVLIFLVRVVAGRRVSLGVLGRHFACALLPIAVAYHLAHYVSYLMIAGQLIFAAASDPFALGWDLFGTRTRTIDISVIGAEQVWWIALGAVIIGHAMSVLVGHRRALILFSDSAIAAKSQIPMTLAMIGLTILSLWVLSQPITA